MKKNISLVRSRAGPQRAPPLHPGVLPALLARPAALPLFLSFVLFLGFFYNLHAVPLFDVDEGAFSEASREMLERRDFVTTYLNGNLRFDKPILVYWLQALSVSLFGINEFAFRLPSALAGVGWVSAILVFTRQQSDRTTAFAAAVIAATTVGVCVICRAATADALLNLLLVLAMFDIYRYMEQPHRKYRYRAYLWMGLGMLAKGPIALLIPFAVSALAFLIQGKTRLWWRAIFDPIGWAILVVVAGPWYVLEYQREGRAFIDGFFMRHNVERFQSPLQGHSGSMLYYLPALLLLLLPYSGLFIRVLPTIRAIRAICDQPLTCFLWCWFLFVLVFFSMSGTKLPHYLLYGISPVVILMAIQRESLQSRWLAFIPPFFLLCLPLALSALLHVAGMRIANPYFHEMLSQHGVFDRSYYLAASLLLVGMLILAFRPRIAVWYRLLAMGTLCSAALGGLILPALGRLQQGPVKEAAAVAIKIGAPVTTWGINMPSFSVYLGDITRPHVFPGADEVIFTRADKLEELARRLGHYEVLYRKGGIALVRKVS